MGKEAAAALLSSIPVKKKPMKMKKRPPKNKNHHRLFTQVVDYLMSDSFMFAPLCSPQFQSFPSVSSGIEENEPVEGNDKKLVTRIGDYLKSDTFLYAPLVIPQPWNVTPTTSTVPAPKVSILEEMEKKRAADALKGVSGKADEPGRKTADAVSKDQNTDCITHTRSNMITRTRVRRETVKHMVYQNCSPLSTGKG